jgi:hypothetical protein
MEAMLGISLCSYPYLNKQKRFDFFIIAYVFSSTKLEKRAEQVLPGSQGAGGRGREWEAGERNNPNNVCTYEYMNKEEKKRNLFLHLCFVLVSLHQIGQTTVK